MPLLHELAINDDDVKYPPGGSYRYLSTVTDFYAKARAGNRPLQELRKISIIEAKGYCYGWHFYQAGDADLVISSDDALFGHPAFRYVGWGPRLWWWAETMGLRKFSEMLFTGRPFSAKEMYECGFVNSVVPREKLEEETLKYAMACSRSRPTDTVAVQKTFLELYKQHKGEYFGSLLTGMVEGMLPMITNDAAGGRPDRGHLREGPQQRGQGQRPELPAGVAPEPLGTREALTVLEERRMSALTGFRVVELAGSVAGEYCGKLLADFGAEIIKVEAPECGSPTRAMAPIVADGCDGSGLFAYLNTNKQSVVLDRGSEADVETCTSSSARRTRSSTTAPSTGRSGIRMWCSARSRRSGRARRPSSVMPRASTSSMPAAGGTTRPVTPIPRSRHCRGPAGSWPTTKLDWTPRSAWRHRSSGACTAATATPSTFPNMPCWPPAPTASWVDSSPAR